MSVPDVALLTGTTEEAGAQQQHKPSTGHGGGKNSSAGLALAWEDQADFNLSLTLRVRCIHA